MRILTVDVGTGTQDVLLYDSSQTLENCIKMILPSPTLIVAGRIRRATAAGAAIALTGRTMGGGPCAWAAEDHLRAGLPVYATPDAARTFDDELDKVEKMGVRVLASEDVDRMSGVDSIRLGDLDLAAIENALSQFGVSSDLDAIAVAVFDHGNAPPGTSDRTFRFEYIAETVRRNDLTAFAYRRADIPERLTRMRAVTADVPLRYPLVVMDTGPAAILGALEDPAVADASESLIVNIGNFHTLAFHLANHRILGLFEHHTGELTQIELETYLDRLALGTITNKEVFDDMGHGALVVGPSRTRPSFLAAIGPRRGLLGGSRLQPYLAVPHGDMMVAGCYGLLRATARLMPEWAEAIDAGLGPQSIARP